MINPELEKAKPKKNQNKKTKPPIYSGLNSRQDTCTPEQYWISKNIYGYDGNDR